MRSGAPPLGDRAALDLFDEIRDSPTIRLWRQTLPAREGRQGHALDGRVPERIGSLLPLARLVLARPIEPMPAERLTVHERANAMDSRPITKPGDQVFLAAMGQDIAEPSDLSELLLADQDRLVAALPDLARPSGEPAHLAGHLRVEIADEAGILTCPFATSPLPP